MGEKGKLLARIGQPREIKERQNSLFQEPAVPKTSRVPPVVGPRSQRLLLRIKQACLLSGPHQSIGLPNARWFRSRQDVGREYLVPSW